MPLRLIQLRFWAMCLTLFLPLACAAQAPSTVVTASGWSSSANEAPLDGGRPALNRQERAATVRRTALAAGRGGGYGAHGGSSHGMAVAVTAGASGIGGQFAVELTRSTNLRFSGNAFKENRNIYADGVTYAGHLDFRSVTANLDWFPFHNAFRVSPGLTLYNGNMIHASAGVPGGQVFYLDGNGLISSPTDPVRGTGTLTFGKRTAPNLTVGLGNIIPRSGRHFSVPFEVGFQYISQLRVQLNLQGSACNQYGCASVASNPTVQAYITAEQDQLNHDLDRLRFYPILSLGFGYRF